MKALRILTLLVLGTHVTGLAQDAAKAPPDPGVVNVDLATGKFDKDLPFDHAFVVKVPADLGKVVSLRISQGKCGKAIEDQDWCSKRAAKVLQRLTETAGSAIAIPPLQANRTYAFHIVYEPKDSATGKANTRTEIVVEGHTATKFQDYFKSGVGVLMAKPLLRGVDNHFWGATAALHIYLVPVNDEQEADEVLSGVDQVLKRVSLVAGLEVADLYTPVPIDHLFGPGTPYAGLSVRALGPSNLKILNSLYFESGVMWFNQKDANPLAATEHGKRTLITGLSGSIDWKTILGPVAVILGGK